MWLKFINSKIKTFGQKITHFAYLPVPQHYVPPAYCFSIMLYLLMSCCICLGVFFNYKDETSLLFWSVSSGFLSSSLSWFKCESSSKMTDSSWLLTRCYCIKYFFLSSDEIKPLSGTSIELYSSSSPSSVCVMISSSSKVSALLRYWLFLWGFSRRGPCRFLGYLPIFVNF